MHPKTLDLSGNTKIFLNRTLFSVLVFLAGVFSSYSQNTVTDSTSHIRNQITDSLIEQKLVALAMEGPVIKNLEYQSKVTEYQLIAAKNNWLNLLTLSLNYNDVSISGVTSNNYVYPKYFFGFNIPLGTLFSRTQVKAYRAQLEMSRNNKEQEMRDMKALVTSKYRQYKSYFEKIILQSQVIDDEETAFLQAKEKFRNGEIGIELHNGAQKKYHDELVKKYAMQLEQDLLKIELERLIGVSLESVIRGIGNLPVEE